MKRFLNILCVVALVAGLWSPPALAADFDYKSSDSAITLTGTIDGAKEGDRVNALVLKKNKTSQDVGTLTSETAKDVVQGMAQGKIKQDKSYELVIPTGAKFDSGILTVLINTSSYAQPKAHTIIYISDSEQEKLINRFNQATPEEMKVFLEENSELLGYSISDFSSPDFVGDALSVSTYLSSLTLKTTDGVSAILNAFYDGMLLEYLKESKTIEELSRGLTTYDNQNKFDKTDFNLIKNSGWGAGVISYLEAKTITTPTNGLLALKEGVFLTLANNRSSKATLQADFEKYNNELLSISTGSGSSYSKADKDVLYKELGALLQKSQVKTISDYKNRFNTALDKAIKSETINPGGNSGGGGGGTIVIEPEKEPKPEIPQPIFKDLAYVSWAVDSINNLYERKVVSGDGNGNFRPNDSVTREEFIKMIVVSAGIYNQNATSNYADVKESDWFYSYVSSAAQAGILQGLGNNTFGTGQYIKRQDMMTLLNRVTKELGLSLPTGTIPTFADESEIAPYALEAVRAMAGAGIVNGFTDQTVRPHQQATRAETAKILYGFLKSI